MQGRHEDGDEYAAGTRIGGTDEAGRTVITARIGHVWEQQESWGNGFSAV
jgi:hypothetical protein